MPRSAKRLIVVFIDLLLSYLTVWLAVGLRLDSWRPLHGDHLIILLVSIGFSLPLFTAFGLYRAIFRFIGFDGFVLMMRAFIPYLIIFLSFFLLIGVNDVPRSIGIIQPILFFIGIGCSRFFIRAWLGGDIKFSDVPPTKNPRALIYGAGSAGRQLATAISSSEEMMIKGFIDDDKGLHNRTINGVRVYPSNDICDLLKRLDISCVLLAIPSASRIRQKEIIESLRGCGIRLLTLPKLRDIAFGRVGASDLHDLDMDDLLGRDVVPPNLSLLAKNITNQTILVTGAGGSIGGELCRQIVKLGPSKLIMVDSSEHALYLINEQLQQLLGIDNLQINLVPLLASVRDQDLMRSIFASHHPNTIFHAAAYKHVPLVEANPSEGIRNNVVGTLVCAQLCLDFNVSHFILISTDKAVRPTNIMGASKRVAELVLQALADLARKNGAFTKFSMVRFGNVLGSSGSVAPLFSAQIKSGGPITLTHPDVTRFFMTIPEAAQLVIQSSSMAMGGEVFLLDMGQPVRIYDLALNMIYLSGHLVKDDDHPDGDIEIKVTGLRPGEKLYEELLIGCNPDPTLHPKIMKAHEEFIFWDELVLELNQLESVMNSGDQNMIRSFLKKLVPDFKCDVGNID